MSAVGESFLQSVKEAPPEVQKSLRVTKKGVFIPENALDAVIADYKDWLIRNNISSKSEDRILERVFGVDDPQLMYLPEGNNCLVGFLSPVVVESGAEIKIPVSSSVLIDSKNYIHPKDPWIGSVPGIRIKSSPEAGTVFEFSKEGKNTFQVKEVDLRAFVEFIRSSGRFVKEYPQVLRSMRDGVEVFCKILFSSKVIANSKQLLVPERYRKESGVSFRIFSNLIFVVKDEKRVVFVYELRGKNFFKFLEDELVYLTDVQKQRFIEVIELATNHKYFLGRVRIKGKFHVIEKKALFSLLDNIPKSHWFRSKLEPRYSLKDVVSQLASVLKYADWVDMSKLGGDKQDTKKRFELKFTPWTFRTGKSGNIYEFVEGNRALK